MHSQVSRYRLLIPLTIALICAVLLTANKALADVSVSCKAGPPQWKWHVYLKAGDVLKRGDLFTVVLGVPVKKKNLSTPSEWKVKSVKDNGVQWQYTGRTIRVRRDGQIAVFGYKDPSAVDGTVQWRASFPKNGSGTTCGSVSLTSPRGGSLVAPSAQKDAVTALVSPDGGSLQSADGTITISVPAHSTSESEEIVYLPQSETKVNNFTVVRSFTLDTYEENDQQTSTDFNQPVMVQATYTDVELNNANEEELQLYYFDPGLNEWVSVQGAVDVAANTVVTELSDPDSFNKLYALMAPASSETSAPLEASEPPTELSEPSAPGSGNLIILAGAALIVLVGWFGLRKRR